MHFKKMGLHRPAENFVKATQPEVKTFYFDSQQANLLDQYSEDIAAIGDPQACGSRMKASLAATALKSSFSIEQHELIGAYSNGLMSMLLFEGLKRITDTNPPKELPHLSVLENSYDILCLASRNQILLKLVDHPTFAYDIDNDGKLVRLVANFKGGGLERISTESEKIELSSHSGRKLGPHTEAHLHSSKMHSNFSAVLLTSQYLTNMR